MPSRPARRSTCSRDSRRSVRTDAWRPRAAAHGRRRIRGHTLCSVTYVIGNAAFVHDTVFMPDSGTARTDFPGGGARQLWRSIQRILRLPSETRLFTGHDYRPNGRPARWESTVAVQKANNLHLRNSDEAKFVKLRTERDRTLPMPALMLSALQVNLAGGRLPAPEADGRRYLKIPLNAFPHAAWGDSEPGLKNEVTARPDAHAQPVQALVSPRASPRSVTGASHVV